jgi:hypothetical protein
VAYADCKLAVKTKNMETLTMEPKEPLTNSTIMKGAEEFPMASRFGIICQQSARSLELIVPIDVFEKIGAEDPLTKMFQENFSMGANIKEDSYIIEFPTNMAVEKIQAMVDEIELAHEAELKKRQQK